MLRRDTNARFERESKGFFRVTWYWRFYAGRYSAYEALSEDEFSELFWLQEQNPVRVMTITSPKRCWWMYQQDFYWEDDDLSREEVYALIADREAKQRRKIQNAMARLSVENDPSASRRTAIPDHVKATIYARDGGRCVSCGSDRDIEYDHIIPLAMGGSNTARNLQLLCATCNRRKGANIV